MNKLDIINKSLELYPEAEDIFEDIANEHGRYGFITAVKILEPILLFDFFMWFRENGEKHTNVSAEEMIEIYLYESSNN